MSRKYNFYAGPATLPFSVLTQIKEEMEDFHGIGMSIIETSHRSKTYDDVHNQAIALLRELLGLPENYQVIFLGGGATLQFSMIPLNFLGEGQTCDFTLTGAWAKKAYSDAKKVGKVNVVFDGSEGGFTSLPDAASLKASPGAAYFHLTSNETIGGVEWFDFPDTGDVPLIADMSSDILSRPLPVEKFGVIYAGAQKNLGPAGVTLVIMREDLLERCPDTLTAYLNYKTHAEKNSLYNTPPVFSIYALKLVLELLVNQGGLAAVEASAKKKADILYGAMDASGGFYRCPVDPAVRSRMNVVFRLPSEELEKKFIDESVEKGMVGLKGHRSVGGCRASIYNAMPEEGVAALAAFMKDFANANG